MTSPSISLPQALGAKFSDFLLAHLVPTTGTLHFNWGFYKCTLQFPHHFYNVSYFYINFSKANHEEWEVTKAILD